MSGNDHARASQINGSKASIAAGASANDETISGQSATDDGDWFKEAAQALLTKPGLELHLITGFEESQCYRYASGRARPPAYFLRALLRSEQGGPFMAILMRGSDALWWRAYVRGLRIAAAEDKIDRS